MTDTKTCPSCGATNPGDYQFCEQCGSSLEDVEAVAAEAEEPALQEISDAAEMESEPEADFDAEDDNVEAAAVDEGEAAEADEINEGEAAEADEFHEAEAAEADELHEEEAYADQPAEPADDEVELVSEGPPAEPADDDSELVSEDPTGEASEEDDEFAMEEQMEVAEDPDAEFEHDEVEAAELADDEIADADAEFEVEEMPAGEDDIAVDAETEFEVEEMPADDPAPAITAQRITDPKSIEVEPLPEPSEFPFPPSLAIFHNQQALDLVDIQHAVTYIGSAPATSVASSEQPADDMASEEALEQPEEPEVIADLSEEAGMDGESIEDHESPDDLEATSEVDEEFDIEDEVDAEEHEESEQDESDDVETDDIDTVVVDLSEFADKGLAKKHVAIFRQNKNYTLYVLADEPTQLNDDLLELGERRKLSDGDIIVLGEQLALRFDLDVDVA